MAEGLNKTGPKMAKLTPLKQAFVNVIMERGNRNVTDAARAAGVVAKNEASLRSRAYQLWHDDDVQEAIEEEARRRIKGMLPAAVKVAGDILENPQEGGATRLKAAQVIMDRAGIHAVSERINHNEAIEANPDQMKRIIALAQIAGVPIERLLGQRLKQLAPPAEEAMYVEMSNEGLEGLI